MNRDDANIPAPLEERFAKERDRLQLEFGARLRCLRIDAALTLEKLAERSDLHANYVGSVERGERNVSLYNMWRLAHGVGHSLEALVSELPPRKQARAARKSR